MDSLQRAVVSLLIDGDDLIPAEVTAILGATPQLGVAKGEAFLATHGKMMEAKTGKWQFGGDWESPPNLDRQINDVLCVLTKDMSAWTEITNRFHCYISIGGYFNDWTGGMTLAPNTLKLLSDRSLPIDFDLYAPAVSD
ncbi:DUF4279 domain-containing protein [Sphingobium sp. WCS2017Hpa-17]|uniref:DUF4279 domain-containing protein n=1 Tax=Sphingobium sp. WCS2017Hpa-17 TaxID=3073638 RepID=UPI00288AF241|nr:DUF4279 domain-containing protein [Sphingobium sp. WCS2017Hpa-17]